MHNFIGDLLAECLHSVAQFRVLIFGGIDKANLHLAAPVGNFFDFVTQSSTIPPNFAAEVGFQGFDLVGYFDVNFGDLVCEPFKCLLHSACHIILSVIDCRHSVLVFCDFLTDFSKIG